MKNGLVQLIRLESPLGKCGLITEHKSVNVLKNIRAASWQNQQNGMCAQRRLRSAWASAQSDQSLRCPHEETVGP